MMGGENEHPQSRTHRRNNNGSWSTSSPSMGNVARLCHYGLKAAARTSKTQRNPGRAFYSCPLPKDHPQNCSYFCWIDEAVEDSAINGDNIEVWMKTQLTMKIDSLMDKDRLVSKCVIGMGCIMPVMCFLLLILLVH
ncbi:Zinc finger, GRF-type [Sesbania bispinosa]|nr:Zinc finger, GRF-type [Sesbania bispinosa]